MGLRFAAEGGKRIPLGDEDWIEVREEISKGTFRKIMQSMPQKELDASKGKGQQLRLTQGEAVDYQSALFAALVIGWSLPVEPTVENYLKLDQESGNAVDAAVADHFSALTPAEAELGKPLTSPAKRQKE